MSINNTYIGRQCLSIVPTLGYLEPRGLSRIARCTCPFLTVHTAGRMPPCASSDPNSVSDSWGTTYMIVPPNGATPMEIPKYYNPYRRGPPKCTSSFGKA